MKVIDLIHKIEEIVPKDLALSFDNVGLLIGDLKSEVNGIYVTLDVNEAVVVKVVSLGINTIISHHPIIFSPMKNILVNRSNERIIKCVKYGINVICLHTNLDAIIGGINDKLLDLLGFESENASIFDKNLIYKDKGIGRVVELPNSMSLNEICNIIKNKMNLDHVRVIGNEKQIKKICIINGSGNSLVKFCFGSDIDLVITGDITYHTAFDAIENDLRIIDMGHFNSENRAYKIAMREVLDGIKGTINVTYDDVLEDIFRIM